MRIRDHKPLILKVIKEGTGKFKTLEDFAENLICRIEQAEEVLAMYSGAVIIGGESEVAQTPITSIARKSAAQGDISERIRADSNGALRENFTKEEIREYMDKSLPLEIAVQPNGFKEPISLYRQLENARGDMNFVRVKYVPRGSNSGAETMISGTVEVLDAEKVLKEIYEGANMILSPSPRKVEPRFMTPPAASLSAGSRSEAELLADIAAGAASQTDQDTGGREMSDWNDAIAKSSGNPGAPGSLWKAQQPK